MTGNRSIPGLGEAGAREQGYSHLVPTKGLDDGVGGAQQRQSPRRPSLAGQQDSYAHLLPDSYELDGNPFPDHANSSARLMGEAESTFLGETSAHLFPSRTPSPPEYVPELGGGTVAGDGQASDLLLATASEKPSTGPSGLRYPLTSPSLQETLAKDFHARKQLLNILGKGLMLWIRTMLILVFLGLVLWEYDRKVVMSESDKNAFNILMTAGSITLGLNIAAALNQMTLNMRWWFLSRRPRSLSEVDVIIKSDVSKLESFTLKPTPWAAGIPSMWLLVNIASQISVACLGLSYSIDSKSTAVLLFPGNVNIANLTTFYPLKSLTYYDPDTRFAANNFGNMALLSSPYGNITEAPVPGDAYNSLDSKIWVDESWPNQKLGYWKYRFLASSSAIPFQPGLLPIASAYTNRSINATWQCGSYRVLLPSGNGLFNNITYVSNTTSGATSWIIVPIVQPLETTFWTTEDAMGNRSSGIFAFEPDSTNPWLYSCNITISSIANATMPEHIMSDKTALMAGSAIAIGGYELKTTDNNNATKWHRAQRYPQRAWGYGALRAGDTFWMGFNIAHFSIGAISVADKFNPRITLPSEEEPRAGVSLSIPTMRYLIVIFALVGGVQFFFCVVTSLVANQVVITDESPLAIARLLQPFLARLGESGSIASGKEIARVLESEERLRVVYTVHRDPGVGDVRRRRLVLSEEERERAMGDGRYT